MTAGPGPTSASLSGTYVGPPDNPDLYELIRHVGAGGEGQVWQAKTYPDPTSSNGITVAVKIFEPADSDVELREWLRRTEAMSHIANPGLARTLRVFIGAPMHAAGTPTDPGAKQVRYLVMEYVDGPSLSQWIEDHPAASLRERLDLLATVAAALDELHAHGSTTPPIAHGDIKPDNLRLTSNGGIKLVDFGLMRMHGTHRSGAAMATVPYTAPELFAAGDDAMPTPQSDRFSFAATVFQTITGIAPQIRADGRGPDLVSIQTLLETAPLCERRPDVISMVLAGLVPEPAERPVRLAPWLQRGRSSASISYPSRHGADGGPFGLSGDAGSQDAITAAAPWSTMPRAAPSSYEPPAPRSGRPRRRWPVVATAGALLLVAAGGTGFALRGGDDTHRVAASSTPTGTTASAAAQSVPATSATELPPVDSVTPSTETPSIESTPTPSDQVTGDPQGSVDPTGVATDGGIPATPVPLADRSQNLITNEYYIHPSENVDVNGKTAAFGFLGCQDVCPKASIDVNLSRAYRQFTGRIGVEDASVLGRTASVQVVADGKVILTKTVTLGRSFDVRLDVRNVLRLQILATNQDGARIAVGDPTAIP